jgi:hypothetical protein
VDTLPQRLSQYQYADFTDGFDDQTKVQKFPDDLLKLAVTIDQRTVEGINKEQYATQIDQENSGGGHNFNISGNNNTIASGNVDQSSQNIINRGSIQGANVNIGGNQTFHSTVTITMGNMTQTINSRPNASPDDKAELAQLVIQL